MNVYKQIVATIAVFASALFAHAANISGDPELYNITKVDNAYLAAPVYSAKAHNLSEAGWYAGLKLTWGDKAQKTADTNVSVSDNSSLTSDISYKANSYNTTSGNKAPANSGMVNEISSSGSIFNRTYYMATTTWYFSVTPEMMYECFKANNDYEITLTIGDNTYTVTVPKDVELTKDGVKKYPVVGLLGTELYGDAQLLADQITLDNYQTVKFLVNPSALTFPEGFAAGDETDGVWGVKMLHNHNWSFEVVDGTNLVATCGTANCPYNNGVVRMWLDVGTTEKDYDGQSVTRKASFDEYFEDVFPGVATALTVNGVENGTMNDARVYTVALSVTGVGGDSEPYVLSTTVTINKKDISGATLVLSPASPTYPTYNAAEQTVTPSVTVGNLEATIEVDTETSTTAATEIGTYSVTVNGTGNFTGTTSGTWDIVNTTGSLKGVAATTSADAGSYADGTLTVTDTTALAYEEGAWTAGLTLTWPMESDSPALGNGHGHYVKPETMQMTIGETVYTGREIVDSEAVYAKGKLEAEVKNGSYTYYQGLSRRTQNFSYLSSTTWTVAITPAVVEAALAEQKTALEYTMRAGALVWGDSTEGDPDGVAFADYKIELSLEDPILFVLGEGETHDLGDTVLTTTKIQLAPGASVTTTAQQTEGAIFIDVPGYDIVSSKDGDVYTYSTLFTHQHAWSFDVVDGTNLVATCANDDCDVGGETRMWLDVGTTEKVYDGQSVTRKAEFDANFAEVFPDASTTLAVNGVENGTINTAGVYTVALSVSGLGDDKEHVLSTTVTINQKDISGAMLVLSPASTTYNAAEQTVSASVTVDAVTATLDNGLEVVEGTCSATEIGTYSVTVNGKGNITGSLTGTWEIVNTTGSLKGVAATTSETAGTYEDGTLTVTNTTALAYEDSAWYAGLTITWPETALNVSLNPLRDGSAQYVKPETMQMVIDGNVYRGNEIVSGEFVYSAGILVANVSTDSYRYFDSIISQPTKQFEYLDTTTWKVALTPAIIEAALANDEDELVYTMNAGAFVWEDGREGDSDGVAFADYTITLSLDEPVEFVLGEGESYDLGDTELTTTKIQLAAGASVTSSVEQTVADAIYTTETGYDVVCTEDGGKYVYTAKITHVHDWTYSVEGLTITATCVAAECTVEGNATTVSLNLSSGDKVYDNKAITASADFDSSFKTIFPDAEATISTTKDGEPIDNDEIKDAGEYVVTMTVTGLSGGQSRDVSRNVTISKVDISEAALVLTPATTPYNGTEQEVTSSVTVNNLSATIEVDAEKSTTAATEMGTYTVIVNGTGNFTGSTSATWSIVNTTGAPTSVAASAAGSMTDVGNDFTLSDSSKLEYDPENKVWYPGITITWPMEKQDFWQVVVVLRQGSAKYVSEESVRITTEDGVITNVTATGSYRTGAAASTSKDFTYLSTTTWKVPLTPEIIEAAIAEEKTSLTYTMNAGAIVWGNETEGDTAGVKFEDYTITIPLEGITLYDENGKQVYPKTEGQTVIDEIKEEVETTNPDDKAKVEAKIDEVAKVAGEGKEQDVADWVTNMVNNMVEKGGTATTFFDALAESDYVKASFELGTETLITEDSEVEVADFEPSEDGFTFEVKIDDGGIDAARVQAASIIQSATLLGGDGGFRSLAVDRISFDGNKITIIKDPNFDREFFKIVIDKDSAK